MKQALFDEKHPLYELFILFHSNRLTGEQRQIAKVALHTIHYGCYDTNKAIAEAKKKRDN